LFVNINIKQKPFISFIDAGSLIFNENDVILYSVAFLHLYYVL
jgi:hypothetical protein